MTAFLDGAFRLSGLWWCTLAALGFVAICVVVAVVRRELRGRS